MISTQLLNDTNILASLKPNEKFKFDLFKHNMFKNSNYTYYFIETTSFEFIMWNDTEKKVFKLKNNIIENCELKIIRL